MGDMAFFRVAGSFNRSGNGRRMRSNDSRRNHHVGITLCSKANGTRSIIRNRSMSREHVLRRISHFIQCQQRSTLSSLKRSSTTRNLSMDRTRSLNAFVLTTISKLSTTTRSFNRMNNMIRSRNSSDHQRNQRFRTISSRERTVMSRRSLRRRQHTTRSMSVNMRNLTRSNSFKGAASDRRSTRKRTRSSNSSRGFRNGLGTCNGNERSIGWVIRINSF